MNRISRIIFVSLTLAFMTGCSSMMDIAGSQLEVPSAENQFNRVVVGLGQVRVNKTIMDMPISSDAKWPMELAQDVSDETRESILNDLMLQDPYVATHVITDPVQEQFLGGMAMLTPAVNSGLIDFRVRVGILYDRLPNVSDLGTDWSHYDSFSGGKLREVEAAKGDIYPNTRSALIALLPVNYKKELKSSEYAMTKSMDKVVAHEAKIGALKTQVDTRKDANNKDLSDVQITAINEKIATLDAELDTIKVSADEKEAIFIAKLDEAVEALKNDIQLNEEQVNLAKNIMLVTHSIKDGATSAGVAFGIAVANIATKGSIQNFVTEEESLLKAATIIPAEKQDLYTQRIERLHKNLLYVIPAVGMGSYYAIKQAFLAGKYEDVAEIIVDAVEAKIEQEKAQAEEKLKLEKAEKTDLVSA